MRTMVCVLFVLFLLTSLALGQTLEDGHHWKDVGNYRKALEVYMGLARQGRVDAMESVFYMRKRVQGEEMDAAFQEVVGLMHKSAEAGNDAAEHWLGLMYLIGLGVTTDHIKSQKWYCAAYGHGNEEARKQLSDYGTKDPAEICAK